MKKKNLLMTAIAIFGLATITNAQVPSYVPTNGLVGYWPFNGNANDVSGNANNGTNNGATLTTDRFGNSNSAFDFDGVNDWINTNFAAIPLSGDYTISLWVKCTSNNGTFSEALAQGGTNVNSTYIGYIPNGNIRIGGGNNWSWETNILFPFGQSWHNIVVVKNNLISSLFLDNVLIGTNSQYTNPINSGSTIFGRQQNNSNNEYWNGKIDDIGIWNRELTQQEITNLYNSTLSTEDFIINDLSIYPNPTSGELNFKASTNLTKIAIYNALGQLVQEEKVNGLEGAINIEKLAQGTYIVKVNDLPKSYTVIKN